MELSKTEYDPKLPQFIEPWVKSFLEIFPNTTREQLLEIYNSFDNLSLFQKCEAAAGVSLLGVLCYYKLYAMLYPGSNADLSDEQSQFILYLAGALLTDCIHTSEQEPVASLTLTFA